MGESTIFFCSECAFAKLTKWQGWPHKKPPIPYLEPVVTERCEKCGSTERLSNKRIFWFNVNEEHNTGLPDYWLLKIDADSWYAKWGLPYVELTRCVKCKQLSTISEMNYPNGKNELRVNCERCGVTKKKAMPKSVTAQAVTGKG